MTTGNEERWGWIDGVLIQQKQGPGRGRRIQSIVERFWSKVEKGEGCWLWKAGTRNRSGYGAFHVLSDSRHGRQVLAHRFSLELSIGRPISSDQQVLHSCDNPPCVNPAHLRIGTATDNMRDAAKRQRLPQAKLTERDVIQIRRLLLQGRTVVSIAHDYDVSSGAISDIAKGETWKHVALEAA